MDANERIQNGLSERIGTLEVIILTCTRQFEALESDINVMTCTRLNPIDFIRAAEDARNRIRETVAVLEATTQ